jgi:hypothetical protein
VDYLSWQFLLVSFAESCLLAVHSTEFAERNVVRPNIMVAPLDSIHDTIQTYHWRYLHSCACVVYTRLVRYFYANLEVVQDDDRGLVLQSTILGHIITVDP